ncbi:hypothetical protein Henu3_gp106 [Mycobacterium phage Henu3 PeY-2017]|nr:hypothetical protein Henu3_gp106 [Mycobacterium phage Henu3 PeY-2017]
MGDGFRQHVLLTDRGDLDDRFAAAFVAGESGSDCPAVASCGICVAHASLHPDTQRASCSIRTSGESTSGSWQIPVTEKALRLTSAASLLRPAQRCPDSSTGTHCSSRVSPPRALSTSTDKCATSSACISSSHSAFDVRDSLSHPHPTQWVHHLNPSALEIDQRSTRCLSTASAITFWASLLTLPPRGSGRSDQASDRAVLSPGDNSPDQPSPRPGWRGTDTPSASDPERRSKSTTRIQNPRGHIGHTACRRS